MMKRAKNHNSGPVLTAIITIILHFRSCRAQSNPCNSYGKCGPYGVCNSQDSPICHCLKGFYPRSDPEWASGNWSSGCVRRAHLDCRAGTSDGFLKPMKMRISGYSDRWFGPQTECEGRCLNNCSCLAYGFEGGTGCRFLRESLIDLQIFPTDSGSDLYIRVARSELDQDKGSNMKLIIILVVVASVFISICIYFSWKWISKHRGKNKSVERLEDVDASSSVESSLRDTLTRVNLEDCPLFKFDILANATNNFSEANKLGKGGFGPVYKGEMVNGREIAVKRLSEASGQGLQEFMNEVMLISKLQHRNLVRLFGCCVENKETMLIYEYMPNKSLDFFLFDSSKEVLDWRKRFSIIEGICRGLLYLHRDSRLKIIHRDLKPSNILLDNDWNPKISDFGMARIYGTKQDHVSTMRVVGTYGYMAPEYAMDGRFSEKSDVFSLGVLMLEIATGRKNTSFHQQRDGPLNLLGHVWKLWTEDNIVSSIDPGISGPSYEAEVVRCIHVGLLCVQEVPKDRPSVSAVLSMLNSEIVELPEPNRPAFTLKSKSMATSSSQQSKSSCSLNDVTLTMIDGR